MNNSILTKICACKIFHLQLHPFPRNFDCFAPMSLMDCSLLLRSAYLQFVNSFRRLSPSKQSHQTAAEGDIDCRLPATGHTSHLPKPRPHMIL